MKKTLLSLALLCISVPVSIQAQQCFSLTAHFGIGVKPSHIVSADFNNDGKADLATANGGTNNNNNSVSLLLGNGNGTFAAPLTYSVGTEPDYLTYDDFNSDGNMDIASSNFISNNVSVLLGNGAGGFAPPVNYTVSSGPGQIISADFNGDGKKDLAVTTYYGNFTTILYGTGTGAFVFGSYLGTGNYAIESGDFNGDGKTDIASTMSSNYYFISMGLGNGTFSTSSSYSVGQPFSSLMSSLVCADFNGDGKKDLLGCASNAKKIYMLFGYGTGTFSTAVAYTVGTYPAQVISADFNGDGKLDVATSNCNYTDSVCVRLNNGNGTFAAGVNYYIALTSTTSVLNPYSLVSADFNGDGKADIATANASSNSISILLNTRPTVSATTGSVCAGQAFTIVPAGANTYSITGNSFVVNPFYTTSYTVTGYNAQACASVNKAIITVTVEPMPNLIVTPGSATICLGETATLHATGALNYTWSTSENTSDIIVSPTVQTTYTIIGTDAACSSTASVEFYVDACTGLPKISQADNFHLRVFPNPNTGNFKIEVESASVITLSNALGELVLHEKIEAGSHEFTTESLPAGVYFLVVNQNGKQRMTKCVKE